MAGNTTNPALEPDTDSPIGPGLEFAQFGAGCFWGVELAFQRVEGVVKTEVGYSQGHVPDPTYKLVCTGSTKHAEIVRIQFDPSLCPYANLLAVFWDRHDPTTLNRQASASPVLESMINRPRNHRSSSPPTVRILGVPCKAVAVFLRFLSAAKCSEEELDKYGIHLLVLSHAFLVPQLKRICSKALTERLTIDNVIDMLQLARLCDAPSLHLRCVKLIFNNIKSVEKTEGWKFVQDHDPLLELQVLQFINELQLRKKRRRRHVHEQSLYSQLSEAMECLEHICAEGCTSVGPCDVEPAKDRVPCGKFATCEGLQLLIRHFATCRKRMGGGGCSRCNRMWQLFRLHSSICDQPVFCRVPLCRQFKMKAAQEERKGGGDDERWKLLVRKVVSARAISSLSLPKRKIEFGGG